MLPRSLWIKTVLLGSSSLIPVSPILANPITVARPPIEMSLGEGDQYYSCRVDRNLSTAWFDKAGIDYTREFLGPYTLFESEPMFLLVSAITHEKSVLCYRNRDMVGADVTVRGAKDAYSLVESESPREDEDEEEFEISLRVIGKLLSSALLSGLSLLKESGLLIAQSDSGSLTYKTWSKEDYKPQPRRKVPDNEKGDQRGDPGKPPGNLKLKHSSFITASSKLGGYEVWSRGLSEEDQLREVLRRSQESFNADDQATELSTNIDVQRVLSDILVLLSLIGSSAVDELNLDLSDLGQMDLGDLVAIRDSLCEYLNKLEEQGLLESISNTPYSQLFRLYVLAILEKLRALQGLSGHFGHSMSEALSGEVTSLLSMLRRGVSPRQMMPFIAAHTARTLETQREAVEEDLLTVLEGVDEAQLLNIMDSETLLTHLTEKLSHLEWRRDQADDPNLKRILKNRIMFAELKKEAAEQVYLLESRMEEEWMAEPMDMDGGSGAEKQKSDKTEEEEEEPSSDEDDSGSEDEDEESSGGRRDGDPEGDVKEKPSASLHKVKNVALIAWLNSLFQSYAELPDSVEGQISYQTAVSSILDAIKGDREEKLTELKRMIRQFLSETGVYVEVHASLPPGDDAELDLFLKPMLEVGRFARLTMMLMDILDDQDVQAMQIKKRDRLNPGIEATDGQVNLRGTIKRKTTEDAGFKRSTGMEISFVHNGKDFRDHPGFSDLRAKLEALETHRILMNAQRHEGLNFDSGEADRWRKHFEIDAVRTPAVITFHQLIISGGNREEASYVLCDTKAQEAFLKKHFPTKEAVKTKKKKQSRQEQVDATQTLLANQRHAGIVAEGTQGNLVDIADTFYPDIPGIATILHMIINQNSQNMPANLLFGGVGEGNTEVVGLIQNIVSGLPAIFPSMSSEHSLNVEPIQIDLYSDGRMKIRIGASFDRWSSSRRVKELDEGAFKVYLEYHLQIHSDRLTVLYSGFEYVGKLDEDDIRLAEDRAEALEAMDRKKEFEKFKRGASTTGKISKKAKVLKSVDMQARFSEASRGLQEALDETRLLLAASRKHELRLVKGFKAKRKNLEEAMNDLEALYSKYAAVEQRLTDGRGNVSCEGEAVNDCTRLYSELISIRGTVLELDKRFTDRLRDIGRDLVFMTYEDARHKIEEFDASLDELKEIKKRLSFSGDISKALSDLPGLTPAALSDLVDSILSIQAHASMQILRVIEVIEYQPVESFASSSSSRPLLVVEDTDTPESELVRLEDDRPVASTLERKRYTKSTSALDSQKVAGGWKDTLMGKVRKVSAAIGSIGSSKNNLHKTSTQFGSSDLLDRRDSTSPGQNQVVSEVSRQSRQRGTTSNSQPGHIRSHSEVIGTLAQILKEDGSSEKPRVPVSPSTDSSGSGTSGTHSHRSYQASSRSGLEPESGSSSLDVLLHSSQCPNQSPFYLGPPVYISGVSHSTGHSPQSSLSRELRPYGTQRSVPELSRNRIPPPRIVHTRANSNPSTVTFSTRGENIARKPKRPPAYDHLEIQPDGKPKLISDSGSAETERQSPADRTVERILSNYARYTGFSELFVEYLASNGYSNIRRLARELDSFPADRIDSLSVDSVSALEELLSFYADSRQCERLAKGLKAIFGGKLLNWLQAIEEKLASWV